MQASILTVHQIKQRQESVVSTAPTLCWAVIGDLLLSRRSCI